MKLFLSALCASFMIAPLSFASECEKGKCDKEKKQDTVLADCSKCKKEGEDTKKEGALAGKCKKEGECDKEEGALAGGCDKCKKDGEDTKKEGALAGKCKKEGECDKEESESTLAHCGKCEKGKDHDKDKKKDKEEDKEEAELA